MRWRRISKISCAAGAADGSYSGLGDPAPALLLCAFSGPLLLQCLGRFLLAFLLSIHALAHDSTPLRLTTFIDSWRRGAAPCAPDGRPEDVSGPAPSL